MPILLKYALKTTAKEIRLPKLFDDDKQWLTWSYCGVYKNKTAESQPHALIAFRELESGILTDDIILRQIPLTALGQVRVGTVWQRNMCLTEAIYDSARFSLDFTKNFWRFNSFERAKEKNAPTPYPMELYPLKYSKDKNWFIEFGLPSGGKLVIPCVEFFTRCYGRSGELKRILATYPWRTEGHDRLYAPLGEPEEPGTWKVKLKKRFVNGDVIFLAHAKYDKYTELAAKYIYSQIEASYIPESRTPAFLKVPPWFQGPADMKVRGLWFDGHKSFLALQILGCSDPSGIPIQRDRENTNKVDLPANDDSANAWEGALQRVLLKPPNIIDLTGDEEPDHSSAAVEIQDPEFEILGEQRIVFDVRKGRATAKSGSKKTNEETPLFSSGETHGEDKGIGYAAIHAPAVMESQGALRDMWNAMLAFKKLNPDRVQAVEWYTYEDGFCRDIEPKLIRLTPYEDTDEVETSVRHWPYLDASLKQEARGVLVVRLVISNKEIYVIEIQRRHRQKKGKDGESVASEESLTGLVFTLSNHQQFAFQVRLLLTSIKKAKGVMKKCVNTIRGYAATFKHSTASYESIPCEAALANAISKLEIISNEQHT